MRNALSWICLFCHRFVRDMFSVAQLNSICYISLIINFLNTYFIIFIYVHMSSGTAHTEGIKEQTLICVGSDYGFLEFMLVLRTELQSSERITSSPND